MKANEDLVEVVFGTERSQSGLVNSAPALCPELCRDIEESSIPEQMARCLVSFAGISPFLLTALGKVKLPSKSTFWTSSLRATNCSPKHEVSGDCVFSPLLGAAPQTQRAQSRWGRVAGSMRLL